MKVVGFITRRRCAGKKLSFADIQVEEESAEEDHNYNYNDNENKNEPAKRIVKVVFRRDSPLWAIQDQADPENLNCNMNHPFPYKSSQLPYGAKVAVELSSDPADMEQNHSNYVVKSWELLVHPKEMAMAEAQQSGTDGISCSIYLKSRADAFLKFNEHNQTPKVKVAKTKHNNNSYKTSKKDTETEVELFSHGDHHAKGLRAKVFSEWLIQTYGPERLQQQEQERQKELPPQLQQNGGVLDIAGGKGQLSIELAVQGKIPATIVDPLVRKHGHKLHPRGAKRIRKADAPHPQLVAKCFNQTTFFENSECQELVTQCSLCVGLHPDECTEDILDVALQYQKPVAIVPCCVFPGLFPSRALPCGTPVRNYDQFVTYLLAKDTRLQLKRLPFEGRNQVIYYLPKETKEET